MSISTIATIVFFAVYGLTYFFPVQYGPVVLAIDALVIAIALVVGR